MNALKILVLNLARDVRRRKFMEEQLARLGIAYERVEGIDGSALTVDERARAVDRFGWWCATGRRIEPGEIGCALSHYGIYGGLTEPTCILEDDVRIDPSFADVLSKIARFADDARPQVFLLGDHMRDQETCSASAGIVSSKNGYCTDGYVITSAAARILRRVNLPLRVPCDHWGRWVRRGLIELYHVVPSCVAQDQVSFGSSTDVADRRAHRPKGLSLVLHKVKRAVGVTVDEIRWRVGI